MNFTPYIGVKLTRVNGYFKAKLRVTPPDVDGIEATYFGHNLDEVTKKVGGLSKKLPGHVANDLVDQWNRSIEEFLDMLRNEA